MTDQNRKTLRSFYCRDYLWEHFEQMAQELGCSMDYLINESMRLYARSRDESAVPGGGADMAGQGPGPRADSGGRGRQGGGQGEAFQTQNHGGNDPNKMNHRTFERVPAVGGNAGGAQPQQPPVQQPQPSRSSVGAGPSAGTGGAPQQRSPGGPPPPPPRPGGGGPSNGQNPGPQSGADGSGRWQQQDHNQGGPPQPPGGGNFGAEPAYSQGQQAGRPPVYVSFNNNRYVIDQDKYVIGRGSKQTDLTIRDGNISRKHCVVIYRNGSYYIKDLDSTNGVEYRGNRIESKKIEEGDVFYLCDYELRFSYQG